MVKYDFLTLRPYSTLARDLPEEVYGKEKTPVVTMPSGLYLCAAKRLLKRMKAREAKRSAPES